MTLAEFQPQVESALVALEWETARARRRASLRDGIESTQKSLDHAVLNGLDEDALRARLIEQQYEAEQDITAGEVPEHPIRSVPMDMITAAVIRRLLRIPDSFPVLGIKDEHVPSDFWILYALDAIAQKWVTPNGQTVEEVARHV